MMPTVRSVLSRVVAPLMRAVEGQYRQGPYHLPITGGWLSAEAGQYQNWWQMGFSPTSGERSAVVERCISLYAETAASLPGAHWRRRSDGGRERVTNSALSRVLHKPNEYETPSNFMLNATHSLYREGNAFALAIRNERFEVESLHLMDARQSSPLVAEDGGIFYRLGGNAVISKMLGGEQFLVPQRDVLHIRLRNNRRFPSPLIGQTPLWAALQDVAIGDAFANQQMQFLANQARPSAVLSTDLNLSKDEVQNLRDRWNEQSKGLHQGSTPILTGGLKVMPWSTPAKDAQLAELSKISSEKICWAFGVPLQLLGLGGAPFSSTESLLRFWLSTSLGFALNHIEQSFDQLFGLRGAPEEYTELDTTALLRSDQKDRIEALARGVQSGIYSPNDARAAEDLPAVEYGDMPRVQAQMVPLSAASAIPSAPSAPASPAQPAAPAEPASVKQYQRDRAAMRARTKAARHGRHVEAPESRRVIRKTKQNALQR